MNKDELISAVRDIGLALNITHNTVTTDIVGIEPSDAQWRVDNSKEIALLDEIEKYFNLGTCPLCDGNSKRL